MNYLYVAVGSALAGAIAGYAFRGSIRNDIGLVVSGVLNAFKAANVAVKAEADKVGSAIANEAKKL